MSSSSNSPPRPPMHIRLNSGQEDLLSNGSDSPEFRPPGSRQEPSRSLIPSRPPSSPALSQDPSLYQSAGTAESMERLLPPKKSRTRRFRDDDDSPGRPPTSEYSSRRTSFSSDGLSRDGMGPFASPFDDSRAPSRAGSDDDNVNTQTVSEKYNITPSAGLLLFPEDVEKDDWLHNPDPLDKEGRECDIFTKRGVVNLGGLALVTLGLLALFIGYPVATFVQKYTTPTYSCADDPTCLNVGTRALLQNIRTGLIDPDTPQSAMTKTAADGKTQLQLVFSDEFNTNNRTFYPGDDPYFTAVDLWYGVTQDLEWYDPDAVTTADGVLTIRFDAFQNHNLNYRSGMVQSWNKMCFTGGHYEASISLPGSGDTIGFWPGFWAMGNLGRPGYPATTDGMWPYSYHDECDVGITKNQSSTDGINFLPGMRLPACTCAGQDHPNPGKSRTAPEIDVLEASVTFLGEGNSDGIGTASQSAQVAPFDIWYQPNYDFLELYDDSVTMMNVYRGGMYQQAISAVTNLNNDWYNDNAYQTYAFEYTPGASGQIHWFVGDTATWTLDARSLGPNGNVGQRVIPVEPMATVMNFGMSNNFAQLNLTGLATLMPATMRFDYVRIYQNPNSISVTCDPDDYPTTSYIADHADAYNNPNLTLWDETGFDWPTNSFVDGCSTTS